ncbi:2Fe-2S iron-sulfur cluster-binding protein [Pendulispora albinea]|uniref:(2Fe-2S)-binding protein n=1 Tax=Pendulispora albinea TaxID=2741071 RepID=A0ABZ2M6M3_9BACT
MMLAHEPRPEPRKVVKLRIATDALEIPVEVGTTLQEVCAANETSIIFGCRKACCGACIIRVIEGGENLSGLADSEQTVLEVLGADADRRLACQCTVLGDVTIEIAG